MTAQVLVQDQDKSFPKSHLELTFWFCLVHVINHSRRRDVKVMRHISAHHSLKELKDIHVYIRREIAIGNWKQTEGQKRPSVSSWHSA
jgi:hypothetical protein